ncbi:helix-turn-helix transcriptional regulator [Paenibacillus sp. IB182496]|uniref:Helix-turn-helix transcriptional regulator n=1 Tax=Paenibacillus sabuli TaxID=2772509 RepID=A0A927GR30_9BACL|nr:helix-turn-helix domain-containing protein [Paenibacillus sabuli]MBD2845013.1 helix-turn-helix transcriptional regulator [Paenibacillus sabuli]
MIGLWRRKLRVGRLTFFRKLIVFAMCLIAFPVVIVGGFSYIRASHTIQEKVNGSALQILQQVQLRVEQSLRTADNAVTQLTSSGAVARVLGTDVSDVGKSRNVNVINELQEGLGRIKTYDLTMSNVRFAHLRDHWQITTDQGFRKLAADEAVLEAGKTPRLGYWRADADAVIYTALIPATALEPTAVVELEVPYEEISKHLEPRRELGRPFVLDPQDRIIAGADVLDERERRIAAALVRERSASGVQQGIAPLWIEAREYNLIYSGSDYNGWVYASLISVSDMSRESTAIMGFTLLVCGGVLLAGATVSLVGTRRLYGPIRRLYEDAFADRREERRPERDELQQIGERVRDYRRSEQTMTRELERQREQLGDLQLLKLLLGEADARELAEHPAARERRPLTMHVLVVQVDTWEATRYGEEDRDLLLFAVHNIVSELIPAECRLHKPLLMERALVCLVGNAEADEAARAQRLDRLARRMRAAVKRYLELPTSVGISRPFGALSAASRAYKEALEALRYRLRLGDEAILYIADVQPDHRVLPEYPERIKDELIDAIKLGDEARAAEALRQFADEVFSAQLSHREYQMMMIRLLNDLLRVVQEAGGLHTLYEEEKTLFDTLFELQTSTAMIDWFRQSVIEPAIRLLEEQKRRQYRRISDELIAMIEGEYDRGLTIESCASRINYHPDYVRHVFRRECGVPFGEYLARYRLDMAKQWLRETDMKIATIAERLQYTNSQNFIRYFRKCEGMTPGQYRSAQHSAAEK